MISLSASGGTNCPTLPSSDDPQVDRQNAIMTVSHVLYPEYFEILPTTGVDIQRALQIQLVAPKLLKSTDSVTISLNVAMDASYASNNDHDPIIGISDRKHFIGFYVGDDRHTHVSLETQTAVLQYYQTLITLLDR